MRKDEAGIWDMINDARDRMTFAQKRLWEVIRVAPETWSYAPRSPRAGEVWTVAIIGKHVIWYDDYFEEMDDDFCLSEYEQRGVIGIDVKPGNDSLESVVESLLRTIAIPG
jgi:hypothetical protein